MPRGCMVMFIPQADAVSKRKPAKVAYVVMGEPGQAREGTGVNVAKEALRFPGFVRVS